MSKPSRDDVRRLAEECGIIYYLTPENTREMHCTDTDLERFAAAMYAAGAEAMRERVETSAKKEVSDWEILRDISVARKESALIESTNILAINRLIDAIRALPIPVSPDTFTYTNTEGEQDERKDYCGSCGEWTGGPLICCHESESANRKPNVTKAEAITVRQTRKERRDERP